MRVLARTVMYLLLAGASLLLAGLAYAVSGLFGLALGAVCFVLVHTLSPQISSIDAKVWGSWFMAGGALLGSGCGLILMARFWVSQAQESGDQNVRACANYLDELSRAMCARR